MTFLQEEEIFPTVSFSDISPSEEVNATVNLSDASVKEDVNGNSEVGEGKQNAKRKISDNEAPKKVNPFLCLFCLVWYSINVSDMGI